jgi:hypothetical protein
MPHPVHYHVGNFPPQRLNWEECITLIGSAHAAVARYDGLLAALGAYSKAAVLSYPALLNIAEGYEAF